MIIGFMEFGVRGYPLLCFWLGVEDLRDLDLTLGKMLIRNVNANLIHALQNESSFQFLKACNNKDLNQGLDLTPGAKLHKVRLNPGCARLLLLFW
jgi:hypothetical protein